MCPCGVFFSRAGNHFLLRSSQKTPKFLREPRHCSVVYQWNTRPAPEVVVRTPLDSQSSRTVCANHSQREICRNSMESATFKASAITEDHKNIRTNTFTSFTPSWPESYTRSLGVSWSLLSLHAVRRAHQQKGARTPGGLRRSHSHTPNTGFFQHKSCTFFFGI